MAKRIAIIAGVGPGTGSTIAQKFAAAYPVVLLSRNPANLQPTVSAIRADGGKAVGIPTDLSSSESVGKMVSEVKKEFGADVKAAVGVFNASAGFARKEFLELEEEEWSKGWDGSIKAAYLFSRALLPLLTPEAAEKPAADAHPPTLIFTGATASIKASALLTLFAATKHALRAMSSSLAKEYGPKGVHVSHAIIDGVIDIPRTKGWNLGEGAKIETQDIADAYWWLHTQKKTGWTWEVDLRPNVEKW